MILNFYSTPTFDRNKKRFSKKYKSFDSDFENFNDNIENLPFIDMGGNIRKYRMALKSKGKGKSGGIRVITFDIIVSENERDITFVMVYDKSEQSNASIQSVKKIISSEL